MEVRNTFKGLYLIECLMNYGQRFMILYRRQWSRPYPRKRNAKRLSGKALQTAMKRRKVKATGKRKAIPI